MTGRRTQLSVGAAARRVWVRLGAQPEPAGRIAAALRISPVAVNRALRELARHEVVVADDTGWRRGSPAALRTAL